VAAFGVLSEPEILRIAPVALMDWGKSEIGGLRSFAQDSLKARDFTSINNESVASPIYKLATLLRGGSDKGWTTNTALQSIVCYSFERAVWSQFSHRLALHEFVPRQLHSAQ
jgi:hypothetical protein